MAKRTFGLGALTVISACVSGGPDATSDAGTPDGPVLAPPPLPARDASPDPSDASLIFPDGAKPDAPTDASDPDPTCPENDLLTVADLDAAPGWKGPLVALGSCSSADITQLESNFKNTGVTNWSDLGNGLGAACKACVFTDHADAKWGPIVLMNGGVDGFINFGACFAHVETEACGKALQYEQFCYSEACNDCTTTSTERQKCVEKAGTAGEMCFDFRSTTTASCPSIQTSAKSCNSILDAAKTLCGGADGGT